jgi:hypothetical protein
MSNLERQRVLREAGPRPAQAEKEISAAEAKEEGARTPEEEAPPSPEEPRPLAEDPGGPPRPRR